MCVSLPQPNTTVLVVSGNASVSDQSSMCNDTYAKLVLTWNNNMTNLIFAFSAVRYSSVPIY